MQKLRKDIVRLQKQLRAQKEVSDPLEDIDSRIDLATVNLAGLKRQNEDHAFIESSPAYRRLSIGILLNRLDSLQKDLAEFGIDQIVEDAAIAQRVAQLQTIVDELDQIMQSEAIPAQKGV